MNLPKTYETSRGPVTVYAFERAWWGRTPCYLVRVRGEPGVYFGDDTEIYQLEEHEDGSWSAWYEVDQEYRDTLVSLNAWH